MDPETLKSFYEKAEVDLAGIRNGILIFVQDRRSAGELDISIRALNALKLSAAMIGMTHIEGLASDCGRFLEELLKDESPAAETNSRRALDRLAEIEASLLKIPLRDDDFLGDISDFVDESFENLTHGRATSRDENEPEPEEAFEIDDEILEIFRSEAAELLGNISANLEVLRAQPQNLQALWKIRRYAHTFKGAAGIVGLTDASELAHRVEDLLDQLSEIRHEVDIQVIDLLTAATDCLDRMTNGTDRDGLTKRLGVIYVDFDRVIAANTARSTGAEIITLEFQGSPLNGKTTADSAGPDRIASIKPPPVPIVRVSLDRLDELLKISRNLLINRSAIAERFTGLSGFVEGERDAADALNKLGSLFEIQRRLTTDMQEKLVQIRMIRFGVLGTRLSRAVHVTCQEENKKAELVLENEDVEIDTQLVDSLVEPLLHLLRNAVVHGIESPETRRLIGKAESGKIHIRMKKDISHIELSVLDDGRGIAVAKLREKASLSGQISADAANSLTGTEVFDLMFMRGVTTAETLNLNAGRGVGMSIVKESIESRGGSILVASEPQKGTTFTIRMPLIFDASHSKPANESLPAAGDKSNDTDRAAGLRVLIVDDSASVREMTSKTIENAGWTALTAKDGRDALEILSIDENRPDIILSDLEMPRLDGYEFLKAVKESEDLCEIPVVMITSLSNDAHRQRALDLGAAEILIKPYNKTLLIEIINQLSLVTVDK